MKIISKENLLEELISQNGSCCGINCDTHCEHLLGKQPCFNFVTCNLLSPDQIKEYAIKELERIRILQTTFFLEEEQIILNQN